MGENEIVVANQDNTNVIPYSFSTNEIVNKKCKLCNCEFRKETEERYEGQKRKKNISEIKRWLKEEKDFDITVNAINNHMIYHYGIRRRNAILKEYTEDVQKFMDMRSDKVSALKARIAIIDKEMLTIASKGDELNLIERRKNAETIKKLADTLLVYETKLQEYEEKFEPVTIIFNQLRIIINDEISHDRGSKKILSTVLNRLKEGPVGEMLFENKG
jgi:hypothetical protein